MGKANLAKLLFGCFCVVVLMVLLIAMGYVVGHIRADTTPRTSDPTAIIAAEGAAIQQARKTLAATKEKLDNMEAEYQRRYGKTALESLFGFEKK